MADKFKVPHALRSLAQVLEPKDAQQPILSPAVRETVHSWMTELWAEADLSEAGIEPRRSAILTGPPGCGKTTLAHHFAARLGLSLICVKMDTTIGSHLGETGRNVAAMFEAIEGQEDSCVLFLDEFDAIATRRTEDNQACAREMNSTVNALLQRLEASRGIIVAATNRSEAIDPAVWRRFGMHLSIDLPGDDERFAILKRYLSPYALPDEALDLLSDGLAGASPALLRQLMEGIKRDLILSPRLHRTTDLASVFARLIVSIRPHADYVPPPLYSDRAFVERLSDMAWPPVLMKKDAA